MAFATTTEGRGANRGVWISEAVDPVIALRRASADAAMGGVIGAIKEGKGKRKRGMDAMHNG